MRVNRTSIARSPLDLALLGRSFVAATCAWLAACAEPDLGPAQAACTPDASVALYERKIEPILKDDRPQSCSQCHLAGIDLTLFVRDTPCRTMACLEQLGLVDMAEPERSKLLTWIGRAKPQSALITEQVIGQERDGFLEWIRYSARCGSKVCETFEDPCGEDGAAKTQCGVEMPLGADYADPGDCSEMTLEALFTADVYQWRERCYPCHFTSDTSVTFAPKWITDEQATKASASVACAASSLATMRTVLSRGYVNLDDPEHSLLLLKPLAQVEHGGGPKFDGPNDPSYQSFLGWIARYAACATDDPALPQAGPPPPVTPVSVGGDPAMSSIYDYCNCMIANCHERSHTRWGETDAALIAGCRAEASSVPAHGLAIESGNFLECREAYCKRGRDEPDACSAAFGETICK